MVAAGFGYLGLLKREFQKLQREDKTGKTTTASHRRFHGKLTREGNRKLLLHATAGRCCNGKLDRRAVGATGFCNGAALLNRKRPWKSILYYSVEGQMKWEFRKLRRKSATTDCNGKGLPREAATGRWNGRQGRLD